MIDYEKINESLKENRIIELMQSLGADRYEEREESIIFPTICHNEDSSEASDKLYYYKNNKAFYCYTEDGFMNIFQFLRVYYETRNIEYNWYLDIYKKVIACTGLEESSFSSLTQRATYKSIALNYKRKRSFQPLQTFEENILNAFTKHYAAEWLNDGIEEETMDKFNILFSPSENKIVIPHYNSEQKLVGIRGRALNEDEAKKYGKYMPMRVNNFLYNHRLSLNLYGLDKTKKNIKENSFCCIFEGEKSVLQVDSFLKVTNCSVAVCGSNFNKFQLEILMKECAPREIVICFDKEEDNDDKYYYKLKGICEKYKNYANFSFIYDFMNILELQDSPTDKGEEVFLKLLQRRIRVR